MRIVEIMSDFREIQSFLSNIRASPSAEDYNAAGYRVLRRCVSQAEALMPSRSTPTPRRLEKMSRIECNCNGATYPALSVVNILTFVLVIQHHYRRRSPPIQSEEDRTVQYRGATMDSVETNTLATRITTASAYGSITAAR